MDVPRLYFAPEYPTGLVLEETSGGLYRIPEMTPFDGDPTALMPIRSRGHPDFVGELMIELVGVVEIAERAHVQPGTVQAWRERHDDFPTPMATLRAGPVWSWTAVERWLRVRPPAGRPPHHDAMTVSVPTPTSSVLRHFRGDGLTATFRLRDRFVPNSVTVLIDGRTASVVEDPSGRRFNVSPVPPIGADIRLEYRTVLG